MSATVEANLSAFPAGERARRRELLDAFTRLVAEKPLADLQRARDDLAHAPAGYHQ